MTRVDEFDAFYHDSRRQVLHQTYAVTGDLTAAILAVQDAYAHAWQHWPKLRHSDPLSQVRPEAMRLATLRRGTNLLRRKRQADTDTQLLTALAALSSSDRRLVILQTAGGLDIAAAAREVGLTADHAVEATDRAVTELEDSLDASTGQIERRLEGLRRITDAASLPRASVIRRSGTRRKHRNTIVAVATSAALVAGAGYLVTAPADGRADDLHPKRQQIVREGATDQETIGATEEQLLSAPQVTELDPNLPWKETGTSTNLDELQPYATCAQARYGTTKLRQAYVRGFKAGGKTQQTAVEAIEVARTKAAAAHSYARQLHWYAGCQVPRVQLLGAYTANRNGTDLRIIQLRKWSDPVRTITVGISRSGFVTSTFVHQIDEPRGPGLEPFSELVDISLGLLCGNTGGECQFTKSVRSVAPPVLQPPGFLGAVDLPPVANLAKVWVPTKAVRMKQNPSATTCDDAQYTGKGVSGVRARFYVVPEAKQLPETFGISETIATFRTQKGAEAYLKRLEKRFRTCSDRKLTARVRGPSRIAQGPVRVRTWWLSIETTSDKEVEYRVALVRNGNRIAHLMFSPVGKFDIARHAWNALGVRAGHRLTELE